MSEESNFKLNVQPILFLEDWNKYGGVVHTTTGNKSALVLAKMLKEMGVKNYFFHLALYDQDLLNINPHTPNLSIKIQIKILIECRRNPWYVLREVLRTPAASGDQGDYVELNRSMIALWWFYMNHITFILVQPRQTGKSFGCQLLDTSLMNFYIFGSRIMQLTKDDALRSENIDMLNRIYNSFPEYLQFRDKTDSQNSYSFTVNALGNTYRSVLSNKSEEMANKAGRGFTSENFRSDEGPFTNNLEIALGAAIPALGAAMMRARKNGMLHGEIYTTTAGDKDDQDSGQFFWYNIIEKAAIFYEKYYDCRDEADLKNVILKAGKDPIVPRVYANFNYLQVGKTHEWAAEMISRSGQSKDRASKDYLGIWGTSGSDKLVDEATAKAMMASIVDPNYVQIVAGYSYTVRWFCSKEMAESYRNGRKLIIGMDSSEAIGNDATEFTAVDVLTGDVVFVVTVNEAMIPRICAFVEMLILSMPGSLFAPERKSTGGAIVDYLILSLINRNIDPFKRIFNWIVNNQADPKHADDYDYICKTPVNRRPESFVEKTKKYFGYATSGSGQSSRDVLYVDLFPAMIKRVFKRLKDGGLVEQILGLKVKNGRIDHANGGHDDKVISLLMAYYILIMGKNLNYYGIYPLEVLKDNSDGLSKTESRIEKLDPVQRFKYDKAVKDLRQLKELYSECKNAHLAKSLEDKIMATAIEVKSYNIDPFIISTISSFLENIKDQKKFKPQTETI